MQNRRRALFYIGASSALIATSACSKGDEDVGAVEDLMREHGIIRRIILVYRQVATKIRGGGSLDGRPLQRAAALFRNFGEDYHERKLEEEHIFLALQKAGGPGAVYVDVLKAQHEKGRQITDYIMSLAAKGAITASDAPALADALDGLELMYAHHAAREDTIVFPAWKATMSKHQLAEMGDKFEDIEKKQFGQDGFDMAVNEIGGIEQSLGMTDLAQFTPPSPLSPR
jgi:hemerythrin-like domain-containing protein